MSYGKASELLSLALDLSGSHYGLSLAEIDRRWESGSDDARRRRTQRALREIEALFPHAYFVETSPEAKTVRLLSNGPADLSKLEPLDLVALKQAIVRARQRGSTGDVERLEKISGVITAMLSKRQKQKGEIDIAASLLGNYQLAYPGPRPQVDPMVLEPLGEALLKMRKVAFDYSAGSMARRHEVHPYGILSGNRNYLLARGGDDETRRPTMWRMDRITKIIILDEAVRIPDSFVLADFAKRSFGIFQDPAEYGEVVWKFAASAAANARGYRFHPDQVLEENEDGTLTVRFHASGHLEMAWFLYSWGDKVEVLAPPRLRELVHPWRRSDIDVLP